MNRQRQSKTRKISLIILYVLLGVVCLNTLCSCKNGTDPKIKFKISGSINLINNANESDVITVKLFQSTTSAVESNDDFQYVGSSIPLDYTINYRNSTDWLQEIVTNRNFEFDAVVPGNYLLYYFSEGYGCNIKTIEVKTDTNVLIDMAESIELSGIVSEDLTLGPNQHILVSSDLFLEQSVTVFDNCLIEMDNSKITVAGILDIQGNNENPVLFLEKDTSSYWRRIEVVETGRLIVDSAVFSNSISGIEVKSNDCSFNNVLFYNCTDSCLDITTEYTYINNSSFVNSFSGIGVWGSSNLLNSPIISHCYFSDIEEPAVKIWDSSDAQITDCVFFNCQSGIHHKKSHDTLISADSVIQYCYFENIDGACVSSDRCSPEVIFSTFNNVYKAISFSDINVGLTKNNFLDCTLAVNLAYHSRPNIIDANRNYWGTTDLLEIAELIWDETDEPGGNDVGLVNYDLIQFSEVESAYPRETID